MSYPFQTQVKLPKPPEPQLVYGKKLLSLGSCFSEHIGQALAKQGQHICVNPFGVLYNPISMVAGLDRLMSRTPFSENELFEYNELFHSPLHHGSYSGITPEDSLSRINDHYLEAVNTLGSLDFLLLTWGTAWIYTERLTGQIVANCHKRPEREFERRLWTVDELIGKVLPTLRSLKEDCPQLQIVSTISPIRHLRDGAQGNQLSKATLVLMNQKLQEELGEDYFHYFPAYEIVLDELRDYRFYADDMLHPSNLTQNIITERFSKWLMTDESYNIAQQVLQLKRQKEHRSLHPETMASSLQREQLDILIKNFLSLHPDVRW